MKEIPSESGSSAPLFSLLEKPGRRSLPRTGFHLISGTPGQSKLERSKLADRHADHQDRGRNREAAS